MTEARIVRSADGERSEGADWMFKATGRHTRGRFDFMVGPVEYFSGPPLHVHHDQDDTFYVLEGVLTVQVGDEIVDLGPGDFATIPPGVPHTFDNVHMNRPVRAINVMTPGGLHDFFNEVARADRGEPDAPTMQEIAERHGVTTVGPPLRVKLGLA